MLPRSSSRLDSLLPRPLPSSHRRLEKWLLLLCVLSVFSAFITPFRLSFLPVQHALSRWELACDLCFCVNILVRLFVILPPNMAYASHRQVALYYTRTGRLGRDLLCSLPLDFIAYAGGLRSPEALYALGVLRLLRLRLVSRSMTDYESDVRLPYFELRLGRLVLYVLLHIHFFACAFSFLGDEESGRTWFGAGQILKQHYEPSFSVGSHYLSALYWAVVSFCTVGYGDFAPQTESEMLFAIVYLLCNFALTAYVVGNMSQLATSGVQDSDTRAFREQMAHMDRFVRAHSLPPALADNLRAAMQL